MFRNFLEIDQKNKKRKKSDLNKYRKLTKAWVKNFHVRALENINNYHIALPDKIEDAQLSLNFR